MITAVFLIALLGLLLVLLSFLAHGHALYFGNDKTISSSVQNSSSFVSLTSANEKDSVYLVWVGENHHIYFTSSLDEGKKFSSVTLLSDSNKSSLSPKMATTEKGNVYVTWTDLDNKTGDSNIEFRSSNDSGKSFSSQMELRSGKPISFSPEIAATEKGNVYVTWTDLDNKTGDSNIEFRSSNDSGKSFGSQMAIRSGKPISFSPEIAATEKGNVYVAMITKDPKTGDSNIEFSSSNDYGMSFSPRKKLTGGKPLSFSPQLAVTEKGNVYLTWVDKNNKTGDTDILFRSSNDSGLSFGDRNKLRRSESILSYSPQIASTEKGDVYMVWTDKNSTTGDSDITFRTSIDEGRHFQRAINLNKGENEVTNSSSPELVAAQNDSVYVVWTDNHIQFREILLKDSLIGDPILISNKTASSSYPQIVGSTNGNSYVVWTDGNISNDTSLHFKKISQKYFDRNP